MLDNFKTNTAMLDVIELTRKLISFNTINPPGNEMEVARYLGGILADNGFTVNYPFFEKNRLHVVAERGLVQGKKPLVLSGHLDVVPLGNKEWRFNPFEAHIEDGKLYGRGSSDMKSGVAAIVVAAIEAFKEGAPNGGVKLVLTAGEELGCQGAANLVKTCDKLGEASAIIIAEPTSNVPVIGHKGGLYLKATTKGKTAHSSMPHLGDNAIYKAAKAIGKIETFGFDCEDDSLLGNPTINVGKINGGLNLNSVPDFAEFTIDVRSTSKIKHKAILEKLKKDIGNDVSFEILVDMPAVVNEESEAFIQSVYKICGVDSSSNEFPKSIPYLTDGAVLQAYYGNVPTVILGPGEKEMAHQTNEYCFVQKIHDSVELFKKIILK